MKSPYKQPRNRYQAENYERLLKIRLKDYRRHLDDAVHNIQHCLGELEAPTSHHYYCDDCGRGFGSLESAHYCCNEHP